tara:strand:+ start:1058 stop:2776 length:1719 start_codon:yes stop_codon:yes gene_type:complete
MRFLFSFLAFQFCLISYSQISLKYKENKTLEYQEIIQSYMDLDAQYPTAKLMDIGSTDSGRKLKLFIISSEEPKSFEELGGILNHKTVLLINNGIHAGESCGIDASIQYAREILKNGPPKNLLIAIIPAYNIGGVLNRNCCSRANQDGPEEHGFRGNARNLDLNRDFIKADALNTFSFYKIFHKLKPHIFVDTHTSNGADYQYTLSLISTQKDKLNPILGDFLNNKMEPELYRRMENSKWEMIPYVNVYGNNTPDKGYSAFLETPRYASGYTALFNTLGFITETHMLKPYENRVESTLEFLIQIGDYAEKNFMLLQEVKAKADSLDHHIQKWDLDWKLDSEKSKKIEFKGYKYEFIASHVSGLNRLKYYRDQAQTYTINYYDTYKPVTSGKIPSYYIVPAAWKEVVERLKANHIKMTPLNKDSIMKVENTYILEFDFAKRPYEGHFPLSSLSTNKKIENRNFLAGDYLISTEQANRRFLVSVLEAEAVDSYLRWNFFDEIFQQKEGFSPYVFEETAEDLLKNNPALKTKLKQWKEENPEESKNAWAQLYFIYKNSAAYEKEHLRYPIAKIWK